MVLTTSASSGPPGSHFTSLTDAPATVKTAGIGCSAGPGNPPLLRPRPRRARRSWPRILRISLVAAAIALLAGGARAGHELPFYPGYYPQEIRIDAVAPGAAGALLAKSALHAYVGGDPFAGRKVPANIGTSSS